MSLNTDNTSLSTASPLLTLSPPHCSQHQPPGFGNALGLFSFSWLIKNRQKRGKDMSVHTNFGSWQLAYVLPKLVCLGCWGVIKQEQVTGLEKTQNRIDEVDRQTQLESYKFMILLHFTAEYQCDPSRLLSQNFKTS